MSDFVDTNPGIENRGEAKYFHGRNAELAAFKERMGFASANHRRRTTFLIQAAPGAGKSALLYECAKLAKNAKWQVAYIGPSELCETNTLLRTLGLKSSEGTPGQCTLPLLRTLGLKKEAQIKATKTSMDAHAEGAILEVGKAEIGFSRSTTRAHTERSPLDVLKDREGKLLLIMDEAQGFAQDFMPKERRDARALLDAIHNGKLNRSAMLIAAGLSATADAFEEIGVSRFKDKCYIELGRLKPEAERKAIEDWLRRDGRAKGDPTPWIDTIAQETNGWPQHISAYAESAAIHLRSTGRKMTPEKLSAVLEAGRGKRIKFYETRARGLLKKERQCIARAVANVEADGKINKDTVIASLRDVFSEDKAEEVFVFALRKGIFDLQGNSYVMPIPSMRDWFMDNYFIERDPPHKTPPV